MSARSTKKGRSRTGVRREYDFSKGVRGKYAARYADGTSVVLLGRDATKPRRKPKPRSR